MVQAHPINATQAANLDSRAWASDAFDLSTAFVYAGVVENGALSDAYVKEGRAIAEKQVVLAGYRLANLLKSLNLGNWT